MTGYLSRSRLWLESWSSHGTWVYRAWNFRGQGVSFEVEFICRTKPIHRVFYCSNKSRNAQCGTKRTRMTGNMLLTGRELERGRQMLSKHPSQHQFSSIGWNHKVLIRSAQEDERAAVQYHTNRASASRNSQSRVYSEHWGRQRHIR